jgi:PAS domain S-box-containing protein
MRLRRALPWTLAWLLLAALGAAALILDRRQTLQAAFDLDTRILHRVLSQRMEQQEAVLNAVTALAAQGVTDATLAGYVQALTRPYPQITGVQLCPAGGAGACRTLLAPPAGLPDLPDPPGGGPRVLWPPSGPQYALTREGVRVWVDAGRLLPARDRPATPIRVTLDRPAAAGGARLVTFGAPPGPAALALGAAKTLGTALQPFPIRFERTYGAGALPWAALLVWWTLTGLLLAALARLWSARREAARALDDERARAQGIVQASTDGIVLTDSDGRVVHANPAAHGILGSLALGEHLPGRAAFQATLSQAPLDTGAFWQATEARALPAGTALHRDGHAVLVEGSLAPLRGPHGRLLGRVLTVREVGPLQQRMLAQLDEGERRVREHETMLAHAGRLSTLGEMSAGLAHELNQPLTALLSYGQAARRLLDDEDPDLPRAGQALDGMLAQARRAADIIARLRTLVRREPVRRQRVDLPQAVQNVLTLCRADLTALDVTVQATLPPGAAVHADPVQVEQIVLNLIRNALDAMHGTPPGERRLTLTLRPEGPDWQLTVQDTGPGLDDAARAALFQPFQTTKSGGLGLGLTLSQTLAQGLGGHLSGGAPPAGETRGAAFTLTLPAWTAPDPEGAPTP